VFFFCHAFACGPVVPGSVGQGAYHAPVSTPRKAPCDGAAQPRNQRPSRKDSSGWKFDLYAILAHSPIQYPRYR
jgi:hypothetical protein